MAKIFYNNTGIKRKEKAMKNYFIKDEALKSVDQDSFGHVDIANNIKNMIEYTDAPFNVAIIGKWGMGKSSLINMLKKVLEQDQTDVYMIQEINAWKYQKEEFGRAFLKQLLQGIEGRKFNSKEEFEHILQKYLNQDVKIENDQSHVKVPEQIKSGWHRWKKTIRGILGISGFIFLLVFIYKCIALNLFWGHFPELLRASFICFCKNVATILIVPIMVWYGKIYMDKLAEKKNVQVGLNFPLETRDDYENYLKSVLREKKYANKNIITIIDDLDRLDSSKIVEALDALKVFMDLDKCIFIVPFDDAILKKALEEKRVSNLTSTESEIDSDLILDKLFQYKVYIPELVKINIKKYAVELFQENCQDFIMEYMNGNMEEACRIVQNIVIHKHVSTPRQVKKLINNFINNMIIACKREKKQTVQKGFATELDSIRMIAKISVLQADFNEFYDTLFLNMNAMEEIVEVYRGENDSPSEEVGRFFENIDERYELKPKYQSLINYLIHTEKYNKVPSLASYIYMAQDKISALTGDKKQQEFMETMLSKNMQSAQKMLENTPVFAEKICQYLDLEDDADDVLTVCNMAINLIESINQQYCDEVIRAISRRIEGCAKTVEYTGIEWLNINQYYWVRNHAEDKSVFDVSMEQYLNKLEQEKDVERVIISMLKYKNDFSAGVKQSVKKVIEEYADDGAYGLMNLAVMGQDLSIEETLDYIPEKMFVHITNELVEDRADISDEECETLTHFFTIYVTKDNYVEYLALIKYLAGDAEYHGLLLDLLVKSPFGEKIPENMRQVIINTVAAMDPDESNSETYNLLIEYPCDLEPGEDETTKYVSYLGKIKDADKVVDIICAFADYGNDIEIFDSIIQKIFSDAPEKEEHRSAVCRLVKYCETKQIQTLFTTLDTKASYSSGREYDELTMLMKELHETNSVNDELVKISEETIFPHLRLYGEYQNYFTFAVQQLIELKEEISDKRMEDYEKEILRHYSTFPVEVVEAYNSLSEYMSEEILVEAAGIFIATPKKEVIDDIAKFLYAHYTIFNEKNENLSELLNFVKDNFKQLQDKKAAVKTVNRTYSSLGESGLEIISNQIMNADEEITALSKDMAKFYNKLSITRFSKLILKLYINNTPENIRKLLFNTDTTRTIDEVLEVIGKDSDDYTTAQLEEALDMYEQYGLKNEKILYAIAKGYLTDNQETEQNEKILNLLNEKLNEKKIEKGNAAKLLNMIYYNTSSDELQKQVVKVTVERKVVVQFKKLLSADEKIEYDRKRKSM